MTQAVKEPRLEPIPLLGGQALLYRRVEEGSWYVYMWLKTEKKRFRKCLETSDKALAIRTAESLVLDALARQQAGQKVLSATLGEVIDKWVLLQNDRLARGEIRSADYIRHLAITFRKQLGGCFGLDTPISALKQEDWDRYISYRGVQGVALDTIRVEASHLRGLISKVGMKLGARLVPELKVHVPKHKRSRRSETFTAYEYRSLVKELSQYIQPDNSDGNYLRDWGLNSKDGFRKPPKSVQQDLERSRRELLRWYVLVAAASGCRPHELAGDEAASLRWKDIEFKTVEVMVSMTHPEPTPKTVAILRIRALTKTGERSVPMVGGKYLKELKAWSRFTQPDQFVFADQHGLRAGKPIYLDALRLHWREVLRRMRFERFKPDLYSLRHFFATQRLAAGAPPVLIAKTLGHSLAELTSVYEHILMEQEGVIRDVWKERTPREFQDMGLIVADSTDLKV